MKIAPLLLISLSLYSLTLSAQQLTLDQWNEQAKTNIRLLPKYGYAIKTDDQKKADQEFIAAALKQDSTNRRASNHLIRLGFQYLYSDITKAMYRFNQAYLLDSANSDIYWGYGGRCKKHSSTNRLRHLFFGSILCRATARREGRSHPVGFRHQLYDKII
jgi:hypothetical protein